MIVSSGILRMIGVTGITVMASSTLTGQAVTGGDGSGFAGAYAPSKHWQPTTDPLALEKLRKFQDLKFGFFYCWGTQTQWETIDQSWSLCPEIHDWNKRPGPHANDDTLTYKKAYELGNCFFTRKADGTRYAIVLSEKDGQPMPVSIAIPASLLNDNARLSLIGGDGTALPVTPGTQDTIVVTLPSTAPCVEAWTLRITPGKPAAR